MAKQHTIGPWHYDTDQDNAAIIHNDDGDIILRDADYLSDEDARLIAAAPELLAALKRVTGQLELHGEQRGEGAGDAKACVVAHAAIAKAENEKDILETGTPDKAPHLGLSTERGRRYDNT